MIDNQRQSKTVSKNVEVKAKIHNYDNAYRLFSKITTKDAEILNQKDIFYRFPKGRLKLRTINNTQNELILYYRKDQKGIKISKYKRIELKNPAITDKILSAIFGRKGVVEKKRCLFLKDNIRFHLDTVKDLGDFIEIEYIVPDGESLEKSEKNVENIVKQLEIKDEDHIECAYMDLLAKK